VIVLLYFLLAAGDGYHEKIVKVLPTFRDKKRAVILIRRVHQDVATYLLTVTMINCGLGVAIGAAMFFAGLPNSVLWGVLAALLNFIPYFGPLVGQVIVGLVGLTVFDNPIDALIPVGLYFVINLCEGYIVTPTVLGRRLTMNPMMVFLAVLVWGWLWGIPGALLAVPLLACFNVICASSERLQPLSEFLGR
jgi:predicted PurR-regulated permease PerM